MSSSILMTVKTACDVAPDDTSFDNVLILHINSVFVQLNDLGIGPDVGFAIEDATATWEQYLGTSPNFNNIKQYMYIKVRYVFDPPANPRVFDAIEKQILELEWRINVRREDSEWKDPNTGLPIQPTPTQIKTIVDDEITQEMDDYPELSTFYNSGKV